jgi:trimeric autotransporter adhesin
LARLPQIGSDDGTWGNILNDFLSQVHDADGTLKSNTVTTGAIADGAVTEAKLDSAAQTKLNTVGGGVADGAVTDIKVNASAAIAQSKIANLVSDLAAKQATITAGTTGQYYRGDKTFQTLDKTAVGLANVDNTSDANKPVSTATQTALNLKANTAALATVATSGSYTDLTNTPTIPTITVAASAPSSPSVGDIWVDTSA